MSVISRYTETQQENIDEFVNLLPQFESTVSLPVDMPRRVQ